MSYNGKSTGAQPRTALFIFMFCLCLVYTHQRQKGGCVQTTTSKSKGGFEKIQNHIALSREHHTGSEFHGLMLFWGYQGCSCTRWCSWLPCSGKKRPHTGMGHRGSRSPPQKLLHWIIECQGTPFSKGNSSPFFPLIQPEKLCIWRKWKALFKTFIMNGNSVVVGYADCV